MKHTEDIKNLISSKESAQVWIKTTTIMVVLIWTFMLGLSLFWNISNEYREIKSIAEATARGAFKKDQAFRFWSTTHGGVYVPKTKQTPPNPNLKHIKDRIIKKPDGTELTLMNPAYMIRQMIDKYPGLYGAKSKITSLKYIYKGNKPDEWETEALKSFEKGNKESYEYTKKNAEAYLRLMRPMFIKEGCLKCHAVHGYKLGDVRGGVGVSVPLKHLKELANEHIFSITIGHIAIWLIVLGGIGFIVARESRYMREKDEVHKKIIQKDHILRESQHYLQNLFDATPNIMITTNGTEIDRVNPALLEFVDFDSVEAFKEKHSCICELFVEGQGFLNPTMCDLVWLDYILGLPNQLHRVKMMKNNKVHTFLVWAKPLFRDEHKRSVVTFTDITELEDAYVALDEKENIMIAQSRHAAMGEMISMIAHQWRQPISVIAMGANNVLADIELNSIDETSLKSAAKTIVKQTQELSKTIDDFRNFFRPEKEVVNVLVEDIFNDVSTVIGKSLQNNNIEVVKKFNNAKEIRTYSRELMQVFINIIKNAKEAIISTEAIKRKISISIDETENDIVITICDSGGGIKEDIMDKIFNPYFSTKSKNVGTGIGLYMSKTIVEKHLNGTLSVYNSDDGACFVIKLPLNIKDVGERDE
ncbi:MAG: DUF3365 domain-containing protein [Campylobacterota bacterium]|nr:DUF3365 domain-containing protein [Campylobacterota bacterium]